MSKYKPYPKYKESGIAWLGEVPEGWEIKRLKYFFEIKKRIAGKDGFDVLSITQKGIKVKDIKSGAGQLSMDYSKYQFVEVGDYAMNHMDLLTGYVDISKYYGVTSPDYRVFSIRDKANSDRYFLYLLQMGYKDKIFYAFGQGSSQLGRWRLPTDQFKDFYFPYPSIKEQEIIADYIDQKTQKIDTLIEKQQTLIKLLKEKRQALVDKALNESDIKHVALKQLIERIYRPVHRDKNETYTTLGLYNRGRGLFHREPKEEEELGESDFYWVEDKDLIISGQFAWEGAIALAKKSENDSIVSHRFPIIRGKENLLNTEYLWAFFTTQLGDFILNEHSVGSAGRNRPLNMNTLVKEKIPLPSMEAQLKVAKVVQIEQQIHIKIKREIELLKERRRALISAVVTGKVDVREEKNV